VLRQLGLAVRTRIVTEPPPSENEVERLGVQLAAAVRARFGRSLAIRQVDAGSCNGCELEIGGLTGPHYDVERFGVHFVASPRHADCLSPRATARATAASFAARTRWSAASARSFPSTR
jgi:NADH:ubiquinone oxidoreductase subunit B-like Fe-S oxidoreductase